MPTVMQIVSFLFWFYSSLIVVRVLVSWIQAGSRQPQGERLAVRLLNRATEPVLVPLRRIVPAVGGVVDVSPLVALVLLEVLRALIVALLGRAGPGR